MLFTDSAVFIRYTLAGSVAAGVHLTVLIVLVRWLDLNATFSSAIGFCAACVVNYTLQYYWTFMATERHGIAALRYACVTLFTLGVNTGLFWLLHEVMRMHYLMAQIAAIGVVVFVNYTLNKRYTFAPSPGT